MAELKAVCLAAMMDAEKVVKTDLMDAQMADKMAAERAVVMAAKRVEKMGRKD